MKGWEETVRWARNEGEGKFEGAKQKACEEKSHILMQVFVILGKADSGASPLQILLPDSTASI